MVANVCSCAFKARTKAHHTRSPFLQVVMDDVMKSEYSMTCVFLGDEGCNCANQECNKHWGDDRGAKVCPHCGHTEQMWWASWVEHMRQWQASGQKGYFVYNASVKLGPGQRTEKQYLDDNGLEYEEVSMEQFHLIRRPDRCVGSKCRV